MLIYWNKNIKEDQLFFLQMGLKHILLMGNILRGNVR